MDRNVLAENLEVLVRHVLVIERDDIAVGCERSEILDRSIVAHCNGPSDLSRRVVRRVGEHVQRESKRDGGLMRHPGQLTGSDHSDDG
jgi:hypothetical protein